LHVLVIQPSKILASGLSLTMNE